MNPVLRAAKKRVKEANDQFQATRQKLKVLRGRVNSLRSELSQLEPNLVAQEQKFIAAIRLLEEARRDYKRANSVP